MAANKESQSSLKPTSTSVALFNPLPYPLVCTIQNASMAEELGLDRPVTRVVKAECEGSRLSASGWAAGKLTRSSGERRLGDVDAC